MKNSESRNIELSSMVPVSTFSAIATLNLVTFRAYSGFERYSFALYKADLFIPQSIVKVNSHNEMKMDYYLPLARFPRGLAPRIAKFTLDFLPSM